LSHLAPGTLVCFLHSFHAQPKDRADLLAMYDHQGTEVTAAVRRGAVTGAQFHPEKSGPAGLGIIAASLHGPGG